MACYVFGRVSPTGIQQRFDTVPSDFIQEKLMGCEDCRSAICRFGVCGSDQLFCILRRQGALQDAGQDVILDIRLKLSFSAWYV